MNRPMKITGWWAISTTAARKPRCTAVTTQGTATLRSRGMRGASGSCSEPRMATTSTVALISTATAAFQPKWVNMKAESHCQAPATISTGGAAYEVRVPPMETLTNSTPSAAYLCRTGTSGRNTVPARVSAAIVMAAGSVIKEPSRGTPASTGREAATTMTTNTNRGSVYWRDSA